MKSIFEVGNCYSIFGTVVSYTVSTIQNIFSPAILKLSQDYIVAVAAE